MRENTRASSPSGRYSAGGVSSATASTEATSVLASTATRRGQVTWSTPRRWPMRSNTSPPAAFPAPGGGISRVASAGSTVTATTIEARIAAEMAIAMSE